MKLKKNKLSTTWLIYFINIYVWYQLEIPVRLAESNKYLDIKIKSQKISKIYQKGNEIPENWFQIKINKK